MADRYDKLLTDYFNGTLDKRVRLIVDDVVHDTLTPLYMDIFKAKYGDGMTFEEL